MGNMPHLGASERTNESQMPSEQAAFLEVWGWWFGAVIGSQADFCGFLLTHKPRQEPAAEPDPQLVSDDLRDAPEADISGPTLSKRQKQRLRQRAAEKPAAEKVKTGKSKEEKSDGAPGKMSSTQDIICWAES